MRATIVLATFMLVAAGCQATPVQPVSSEPAWHGRPCHDRPFEAGFCQQPSNFHLGAALSGR